jgi:hypothetical protein
MSQLADVATWVALITGAVGITLSIVAIWFTFRVESSSRRVSETMIKSLQKIESSVERSSADTQGLIKVGWDRMLGSAGLVSETASTDSTAQTSDESNIKQIAAGLAEELKSELAPSNGTPAESIDEDRIVQRVSEAIQAQLRVGRRTTTIRSSDRVGEWVKLLSRLSPTSYELVRFLGDFGHMNRNQYSALNRYSNALHEAIAELRRGGILVPLSGEKEGEFGEERPVYWFPPGEKDNIRIAFELDSRDYARRRHALGEVLRTIGYLNDSTQPGVYGWNAGRRAITDSELKGDRNTLEKPERPSDT